MRAVEPERQRGVALLPRVRRMECQLTATAAIMEKEDSVQRSSALAVKQTGQEVRWEMQLACVKGTVPQHDFGRRCRNKSSDCCSPGR